MIATSASKVPRVLWNEHFDEKNHYETGKSSWNKLKGQLRVWLKLKDDYNLFQFWLSFTWLRMYHLAFLPLCESLQVKETSSQAPYSRKIIKVVKKLAHLKKKCLE